MNLRAFNDLDHMAPVAFGLLSKGHEVLMLISSSELSANDKRLVWLSQEFPNCRVSVSRVGSLVRERLSGAGLHRKALRFLLDFIFIPRLRWGYNAYVFEWSDRHLLKNFT